MPSRLAYSLVQMYRSPERHMKAWSKSEYNNLAEDAKHEPHSSAKSNAKGQRHTSGSKVVEDNLITENDVKEYQNRSYQELSSEFRSLYPKGWRFVHLISLMYDRLTLVDNLSHKEAEAKIYNDHQDLPGFSRRNIRRNLPLDNATVPRRIRPSWPKNSNTKSHEMPKLSHTIQETENQNASTSNDSEETISSTKQQKQSPIEKNPNNHEDNGALYVESAQVLTKQAFVKADEIPLHEIEFTIPREKYLNLEEAMQKSRDSIRV
jgi:hypothetical protein